MSVELPKDAKGREIPLDTVALFNRVGNVYSIVCWTFTTDFDLSDGWSNKWRAITDRGFALDPALMYLTTAASCRPNRPPDHYAPWQVQDQVRQGNPVLRGLRLLNRRYAVEPLS